MILITDPKLILSLPNITLQCEYCDRHFEKPRAEVIRSLRCLEYRYKSCCRFCSRSCFFHSRHKLIDCICEYCGIDFTRTPSELRKSKRIFCGSSCSAKFSNANRARKIKSCLNCNSNLFSRQRIYCSKSCQKHYERGIRVARWLANPSSENGKISLPDFIRDFVIQLSGYKCSECNFSGVNPKSDRTIIQVDHIDGNPLNNEPGNLRALCPNCHAMTPTFGNLSKSTGRRQLFRKNVMMSGVEPLFSDFQSDTLPVELHHRLSKTKELNLVHPHPKCGVLPMN